jgi:glucose/mannose-6-phosphate isomerase
VIDLDNRDEIRRLDPMDVSASTDLFAAQCQQIVEEHYGLPPPQRPRPVSNVLICGMGGSGYGPGVVNALFWRQLKCPVIGVSDYHLPGFAGEGSLVLLTSYSGTTEEVLSCAQDAEACGAQVAVLSAGGALAALAQAKRYAALIFDTRHNPSRQPRLGTGYMITGTLVLLNRLGVVDLSRAELESAIGEVRDAREAIKRTAQVAARQLCGFIPVVFASEHLVGNAHIIRNQFNETSKSFSAFEDIPELNHHLMEGLKFPADRKLKALFIASDLYSRRNQQRVALTEDVVRQNGVDYLEYAAGGSTKLAQVLNVLAYGGYLTLYLGLLYGQDPSLVPWVDYFKARLSE